MELPESFKRTVLGAHRDGGMSLEQLPELIADCAKRWSLRVGRAFTNLSHYYVAPAVRLDGTDAVLKLGPPNSDLFLEIEALRVKVAPELIAAERRAGIDPAGAIRRQGSADDGSSRQDGCGQSERDGVVRLSRIEHG